jgi:hypothetical protein
VLTPSKISHFGIRVYCTPTPHTGAGAGVVVTGAALVVGGGVVVTTGSDALIMPRQPLSPKHSPAPIFICLIPTAISL